MPTPQQIAEILRLEIAASTPDGRRWVPGAELEDLKLTLLELLPEIKAELFTRTVPEQSLSRESRRQALVASRTKAVQSTMKLCGRCNESKHGSAFYVRHAGDFVRAASLHAWCIECCKAAARVRLAEKKNVRLILD